MVGRIAAFDVGDKRVGVAFSDPFNEYALVGETFFRTGNLREDVRALLRLAEKEGVGTIVCGLPLNADGTESEQTRKARRFAEALRAETALPVLLEDERYTTREARSDLAFLGVSAKKDKTKKSVDSLAAAYILEGYLAKIKKGENTMDYKEEANDYEGDENLVELVDEDGNTLKYEHVGTIEYKGEWYCFLTPEKAAEEAEEDEEGEEIAVFHIVGDEDDEQLETIEDEALLDEVFAEFCNLYGDSEDADDAAALEPDEE